MGKKLIRIAYRKLRRDEQYSFNEAVNTCMQKACPQCGRPYAVFVAASEALKALRSKKIQQKPISLAQLDAVVDKRWHSFCLQVHASQEHPYEDVRAAANKIADVFDQVKRPTKLNYDREYGALQNLIDGLNGLDPTLFATALLGPHWDALRDSVNEFLQAKQDALEFKEQQTTGEILAAVMACSSAWTKLATYLEAKEDAGELDGAGRAIDLMNLFLSKLDALMKAREKRAKKKKDEAATSETVEDNENLVEEALSEEEIEA